MTSLFHNVTVSPLDGQSHAWDDNCEWKSASHAAFAKEISDQQIAYLQSLPLKQQDQVLGVAGFEATQRAKTILLNEGIEHPGLLLTKQELDLAVKDCYFDMQDDSIDEIHIFAVIEGILDRAKEDAAITKGYSIQEGVGQLLHLGSRMIKGQGCGDCGEGKSGEGWDVQHEFANGLKELEEFGREMKLEWRIRDRARFSLEKLCLIYPSCYQQVRHLAQRPDHFQVYFDDQLESMWCDRNPGCICWDMTAGEEHLEWCKLSESEE